MCLVSRCASSHLPLLNPLNCDIFRQVELCDVYILLADMSIVWVFGVFPGDQKIFFFFKTSVLALVPTHSPIHWVWGAPLESSGQVCSWLLTFIELQGEVQQLRWSRGSVLPLSTQICGFKPGRSRKDFSREKNPQHSFLWKGSKAVGPMSQICGM